MQPLHHPLRASLYPLPFLAPTESRRHKLGRTTQTIKIELNYLLPNFFTAHNTLPKTQLWRRWPPYLVPCVVNSFNRFRPPAEASDVNENSKQNSRRRLRSSARFFLLAIINQFSMDSSAFNSFVYSCNVETSHNTVACLLKKQVQNVTAGEKITRQY